MNLQPLFDVKTRLEQAAIAGTGLLAEDFRLQRAAEALKPLAAASPVFAKIDSGLQNLLAAPPEDRSGQLLDLLSLVDAVSYTQGACGMDGELTPLPAGFGTCAPLSYGQLQPLLEALTGTGGGRMNLIRDMWENHPEYFGDFRVLPALIPGLGDGYAELAELISDILKAQRPEIAALLKKDFDPAGKKEMVRRVEVISALEGSAATPWLKEVLSEAKKDVRTAIITALGTDSDNTDFLLQLSKGERGSNRDAALKSLALQEGEEVQEFWKRELQKNSSSVHFLEPASSDWASDLTAAGLQEQLRRALANPKPMSPEFQEELLLWLHASYHKSSPAMLDFWRWADKHLEEIGRLQTHKSMPLTVDQRLTDMLFFSLRDTKQLCDLCFELWEKDTENPRWLPHAFLAALLTLPAEEVYDRFSPYVLTAKPLTENKRKRELSDAVLKGLSRVYWDKEQNRYATAPSTFSFLAGAAEGPAPAQPLDPRWIRRLIDAVWKPSLDRQPTPFQTGELVDGFDTFLARLVNRSDEAMCRIIIPWLRRRALETGFWNSFSRWLLYFGSSPLGILADSMKKSKRAPYLYSVWSLLDEASKTLPAQEMILLLEEIQAGEFFTQKKEVKETVFTKTIVDLQAGRPFPEWHTWNI